ncbi:hypothetical protein SAMN05444167_1720 [Terriglobus roseus]|uniref:Uncharacterized protein n=2 Tax=Terriglobus roseus TaxID=392734 RepID=A0A1G7J7Q8_9BACT|nr:hypothetical protein SAMN05444167_1720 [Terriglobus roseus]
MRSAWLVTPFFLFASLWSNAQEHLHQGGKPGSAAPITITINPESRVSVVLSGSLPVQERCGVLTALPIKVINQSFATVRLEASLINNSSSSGVTIEFHPEPLRGIPEEFRSLGIRLAQSGPVDITISFGAQHVAHDLGGRDQIHFVMHCFPSQPGW